MYNLLIYEIFRIEIVYCQIFFVILWWDVLLTMIIAILLLFVAVVWTEIW
jgi:hypothetical protein